MKLIPEQEWRSRGKSRKQRLGSAVLKDYKLFDRPAAGGHTHSAGSHELPALDVVRQHFGDSPSVVDGAEACISAVCSLLVADADCCVALVLEGPPSAGKTTSLNFLMVEALREASLVVVSDNFTPAAFVSHAANRTEEDLRKNDLLPRIQHRALVVPDLAPTFSAREEDLARNVGILTRILDGQGYESDSGTHGHRGYHGDFRFTLLAATTPLSQTAWRTLARLGNRIVMLEAGYESVSTDGLVASATAESSFNKRVRECSEAVADVLMKSFHETGGYGSVSWDCTADDPNLVTTIAKVAQWVVKCRGAVLVESDRYGSEGHAPPQIEVPYRLLAGLYSLAKGHAIACGRRQLVREDVQLAVRIGLDSMPFERRRVVRALLRSEKGELTSADAESALDMSRPTARKAMEALHALGAVHVEKDGAGTVISLLDSERWLREPANGWALARVP